MEAHEIIDATMGKGEAKKLHDLTGNSIELFNSYRRAPRCKENPTATGNYSPLYHYKQYFHLRRAANPEGAMRMHNLLSKDIQDEIAEELAGENPLKLLIQNINQAMQVVAQVKAPHVEDADGDDLILLDGLIDEMEESLSDLRDRIRGERSRRRGLRKVS